MIIAADEVARSLAGALDLLQRRAHGLRRFDTSSRGVRRSFLAFLLLAPTFVTLLAAERASRGLLVPGAGLFDSPGLTALVLGRMAVSFATFPILGYALTRLLDLTERYPRFVVACNWSSVLAGAFLTIPAYLYAFHMATAALATFYTVAFVALFAHLRWFAIRTALGISGGLAACVVGLDLVCELTLAHLV